MPSITYAYGLFDKDILVGVLTIGKPASPFLCKGLLGNEYSNIVYELNRLVINDGLPKNILSWFVSQVLKKLNQTDIVLVSYADTTMSHHGYIYQATNWIYTGATKSRTDKYTPDGKHSRHYNNDKKYLRKFRSAKHRYVWFSKKCKKLINNLKYPILNYPKGDNNYYKLGYKIKDKIIDNRKAQTKMEKKFKGYLATHFFNDGGLQYTASLAEQIRKAIPELDLYVPQENAEINDKSKEGLTAKGIAQGDNVYLENTDILIASLDGVEIDSGVSCEIGYFAGLIKARYLSSGDKPEIVDKLPIIIGLYTDVRRDGDGHNHYYINLYTKGVVEIFGKVVHSTDEAIEQIKQYIKG